MTRDTKLNLANRARAAALCVGAFMLGCGSGTAGPAAESPSAPVAERPAASPPETPAEASPAPPPTANPTDAPPVPAAGIDDTCARDSECQLSTFPGCCSCCQCAPLFAARADALADATARCAIVECARPNCDLARCVPCGETAAHVRAVCRSGRCVVTP